MDLTGGNEYEITNGLKNYSIHTHTDGVEYRGVYVRSRDYEVILR